ncbi:hypothetical protein YC2023_035159 [Brassica napus]
MLSDEFSPQIMFAHVKDCAFSQKLKRERSQWFDTSIASDLHGNPRLCQTKSCTKPQSKDFPVVIVATAASVIILIAVLVLVFVLVFRKKNQYTAMQGNSHLVSKQLRPHSHASTLVYNL